MDMQKLEWQIAKEGSCPVERRERMEFKSFGGRKLMNWCRLLAFVNARAEPIDVTSRLLGQHVTWMKPHSVRMAISRKYLCFLWTTLWATKDYLQLESNMRPANPTYAALLVPTSTTPPAPTLAIKFTHKHTQ